MHLVSDTAKKKIIEKKVKSINEKHKPEELTTSLDQNMAILKGLFADVDILRTKIIQNAHRKELRYGIVFCDGMVSSAVINDNVVRPLMLSDVPQPGPGLMDSLTTQVVQIAEAEQTEDFMKIIQSVTYGDTILFADGASKALILNTKGFESRSIMEPDSEKTLTGPREGFSESLMKNLSLIRRRVRTHELKMKMLTLGRRMQTAACVCYIEGIVSKKILNELLTRLSRIDIDGVLDTNYITEMIRENRYSPFRTVGYTERPDSVIAKLLEGRIAIFLDGTPTVLTVPYLFIENFQSSEDYYLSFYYTSFSRLLRILGFLLTVSVPGLYIAIVAFHHEMLPTPLLINIAIERQGVPLPAAVEAFVMLVVFDILRETGVRMPSSVGQALSIVGALVIGQAAVQAKLVAAPMIIVVATTGITNLLVPKSNAPVIYFRFFVLLLSSMFGLFGFVIGMSVMAIHVFNLQSLGIPQVTLTGMLNYQEWKDVPVRSPWWDMVNRTPSMTQDIVRQAGRNGDQNG
jgi:spore germination protein KA